MTGNPSGEVERLEPGQLPAYLSALEGQGLTEVTWNRQRITLTEAWARAAGISQTATVVADGTVLYVAEPDHSADEPPPEVRTVPIQLGPRRREP